MNQADRLLTYLRHRDVAPSSLDIVLDLHILNTTGRISDLRAQGVQIDCVRDKRGVDRYHLVEKPEQTDLGLAS